MTDTRGRRGHERQAWSAADGPQQEAPAGTASRRAEGPPCWQQVSALAAASSHGKDSNSWCGRPPPPSRDKGPCRAISNLLSNSSKKKKKPLVFTHVCSVYKACPVLCIIFWAWQCHMHFGTLINACSAKWKSAQIISKTNPRQGRLWEHDYRKAASEKTCKTLFSFFLNMLPPKTSSETEELGPQGRTRPAAQGAGAELEFTPFSPGGCGVQPKSSSARQGAGPRPTVTNSSQSGW